MKKFNYIGSLVLLCLTLSSFSIFAQFEPTSIYRDLGTQTPNIQPPQQTQQTQQQTPTQNNSKAFGTVVDYNFGGGSGTLSDPFLIYTPEHMIYLANLVNNACKYGTGPYDFYAHADYKLMADLDFSQKPTSAGYDYYVIAKRSIELANNKIIEQIFNIKSEVNPNNNNERIVKTFWDDSQTTNTSNGDIIFTSTSFSSPIYHGDYTYQFGNNSSYNLTYSDFMSPIGYIGLNPYAWCDYTAYTTTYNSSDYRSRAFAGRFDGNRHTIRGLDMTNTYTTIGGLFGYIQPSYTNVFLKDLTIENCTLGCGNAIYAGVVGYFFQNSSAFIDNVCIKNSEIKGNIVGGIVGIYTKNNGNDVTIKNCSSIKNNINGSCAAGGIVGATNNCQVALINCTVSPNSGVIGNVIRDANTGNLYTGTNVHDFVGMISIGSPTSGCNLDDTPANSGYPSSTGTVPDFCYINGGVALDPDNASDKEKLDKLAQELDGTLPITDNIIIPEYNKYYDGVTSQQNNDPTSTSQDRTIKIKQDWWQYCKPGYPANHIIEVDIDQGGGILDKTANIEASWNLPQNNPQNNKIRYKKTLNLQQWNLIGFISQYMHGAVGFNGQPMENKVNFLSNTAEKNDFAALRYNYTNNNWDVTNTNPYLVASDDLSYFEGIFVWPFNTAHPNAASGNWDYTTTTTNNPILYQEGWDMCPYGPYGGYDSDYNTAFVTNLRNNGNASGGTGTGNSGTRGRWFSLANPFSSKMSVKQLITDLERNQGGNNGTVQKIQGKGVYVYNNGNWEFLGANDATPKFIVPGQGFLISPASNPGTDTQIMQTIQRETIYGYTYEPTIPAVAKNATEENSTEDTTETIVSNNFDVTLNCSGGVGFFQMRLAMNDEASNDFDAMDAYAMLSSAEDHKVEGFFTVDGIDLRNNYFATLPYEVPVGFSSTKETDMVLSILGNINDIDVYLVDAVEDTVISNLCNDFVCYLHIDAGKNEGKYKILLAQNNSSVEDILAANANISIWNNNREITINGKDLKKVEVFNALGQKVYEDKISGNAHKFNLNTIQGAYIIKAYNKNNTSKTAKITIAK